MSDLTEIVSVIRELKEKDWLSVLGILVPSITSLISLGVLIFTFNLNRRVFKLLNKSSIDTEICKEHIKKIIDLLSFLNNKRYLIQIMNNNPIVFSEKYGIIELIDNVPDKFKIFSNYKLLIDQDLFNDLQFNDFINDILLPTEIRKSLMKLSYTFTEYKPIEEKKENMYFNIGNSPYMEIYYKQYYKSDKTFDNFLTDYKELYKKIKDFQENPRPMLDLLIKK